MFFCLKFVSEILKQISLGLFATTRSFGVLSNGLTSELPTKKIGVFAA